MSMARKKAHFLTITTDKKQKTEGWRNLRMLDRKSLQWGTGSSPYCSHFSATQGCSLGCLGLGCHLLCSHKAHASWKWIAQWEECFSKSKVCTAQHCCEVLRAMVRENCASTCLLWILWGLNPVSCTAETPRLHRLQDKGKISGQDGDRRWRGATVKKRSHPDTHTKSRYLCQIY